LKKKLLSPLELKEFRLQQEEQRRLRAAEIEKKRLDEEKKNKRLTSPKDLLDPKPAVEVKEEPVVVEEPKDPIEVLRERLEQVASTIKEPKYYDEDLAKLEVLIASKVGVDEINYEPINQKIQELRQYISELPEVKYYDEDVEKLTERVDELQVSGSEIFQQHGESLREIKKVTHQMLKDLDTLSKLEIPEAFDPSDIVNDIAATKETFYERVAELKKELSELPEVKYYDEELSTLRENIESVKESIPTLPEIPEIKYYDSDLDKLSEMIEDVRKNIPELPEVKYYDNEIAALEKALNEVENKIPQIPEISELPEVKYYDEEVEILSEDIDKVRDSLIDIKLSIRAVEKSVTNVENREIPEAFDPTGLQIEIEKAFKEIEKLKEQPVTVKEDVDPLLPLDQKFVTFDDLATHYRTFINRVQQQLMSLGGGGEVNLRYLDDIDRSSISDGKVLSYDAASGKFKFISPGAASSLWSEQGANIYRNSNVGINSADPQVALDVVGDASITGVITATSFYGDGSNLTGVNADTAVYATNAGIASYADVAGIATVAENLTGSPSIVVTNITAADASFSGNVLVTGISTFNNNIDANGDLDVDGVTNLDVTNISETLNVVGLSTFGSNVDINADLDVDGRAELDTTNISETLNVVGLSTFGSNVDINADLDVSGDIRVDGNVSIAGTLTYEDVTNVDAIGLITARDGIEIGFPGAATTLSANGNATFSGVVTATAFTGEFVTTLDKTLQYYPSGSLSTVTSDVGTKTFYYDNVGVLTAIVGTGVYVSKTFTYDGDGNLIFVDVL
jgi:muconolactone delta-isomerase